ncbi:MAG: YfcE family phosphodiesterase [Acutalibacteraceae bacterium]|jgi:putative phosphoesterase
MRMVVISDSHHRSSVIDKILAQQPNAQYVFFLGDNAADIEDFEHFYPEKTFYTVCGNCDFFSDLPAIGIVKVAGQRVLYTHGHTLNVKSSLENLFETAKRNECNIALFGHTHIPKIVYEQGIYFVNPGSCAKPIEGKPTYAVIDITEKGILPAIINVE